MVPGKKIGSFQGVSAQLAYLTFTFFFFKVYLNVQSLVGIWAATSDSGSHRKSKITRGFNKSKLI